METEVSLKLTAILVELNLTAETLLRAKAENTARLYVANRRMHTAKENRQKEKEEMFYQKAVRLTLSEFRLGQALAELERLALRVDKLLKFGPKAENEIQSAVNLFQEEKLAIKMGDLEKMINVVRHISNMIKQAREN